MQMLSFRPLSADDVEVRVAQVGQNAVQLLLYKTSRTDMALLDETVGPENWQCDYRSIDEKLFCGIGCRFQDGEWVWKWDTGTPSNMEAQKGEASDAFKRAGFKWGIGRELYTTPDIWVKREQCRNIKKGKNGREQCYDKFVVTDMSVVDGRIAQLTICNASNRMAVVYGSAQAAKTAEVPDNDVLKVAWERVKKAVWGWCERHECADEESYKNKLDGIKTRPEWKSQSGSLDYLNSLVREFEDG